MDPFALSQLILALFDSESELRRFLNLVGLEKVERRTPATKRGGSLRVAARDASEALVEMNLVDEDLFAELARRQPERADDIWAVARELGVVAGATPATTTGDEPPSPSGEVPARYADYAARLRRELAEAAPPDHDREALTPPRWPWTAAASVLGSFRPAELYPLGGHDSDGLSTLAAFPGVVFMTSGGRWALEDRVRVPALERLIEERGLTDALDANEHIDDAHRDFIESVWVGRLDLRTSIPHLSAADLSALDQVLRWLEPAGLDVTEERALVYAAVERRSLIDPLRKLVADHFRGRHEERQRLTRHVMRAGGDSTMAVFGPGGAGKSSLLASVLVELEASIADRPVSFAYVDFDKTRHNPRNPRGLVEQIARQLRLLYAVNAVESRGLAAVEAVSAGTDLDLAAEVLDLGDDAASLDLDGLIEELATRLEGLPHGDRPPLVLVLDTFEEVQIQGPGALKDVRDLQSRFERHLPGMKVVVSGRGDLSDLVDYPEQAIRLGDLDPNSADAVLESLGVEDVSLRSLVFDRFGGNPLVLHLAAEALRRMATADRAFKGIVEETGALAAVEIEQLQGMLYERILGHIADPEIVKVAHPGLTVRRVDVDVIREVLAEPCGLDPDRAPAIFERLRLEISMFEEDEDGALRHRQDVRRLMLRSMANESRLATTIAEIHRRAIDHYRRLRGPKATAEEVYHRLMSGQDPRTIDVKLGPEERELLLGALEEPLPPPARTWLRRRLGLVAAGDERESWDQDDWEAEAETRARSWLESSDPTAALEVLAERSERLPGSRLYPLEAAALTAVGRLDEAAEVVDRGMRSCRECEALDVELELAEQATRLAVAHKDADRIVSTSQSTLALTDLTGETVRGIGDLTGSVAALHSIGASGAAEGLAATVAERFATLPADVKRENPALVRAVVQTAGAADSTLLAQVAEALGDAPSPGDDPVFRDDAFALTRLLEDTRPEARDAMNELAVEMGLHQDRWTPRDLAASAVRSGRTGRAVAVGLDWAREPSTARRTVVEQLAVPVDFGDVPWHSGI